MRISDWSSDVCSSDLLVQRGDALEQFRTFVVIQPAARQRLVRLAQTGDDIFAKRFALTGAFVNQIQHVRDPRRDAGRRSDERRVGKGCVGTGRSRWSPYP